MHNANIATIDGAVPLVARHKIFSYVMNSAFRIGWPDALYGPNAAFKSMYSMFSPDEWMASGLGEAIAGSQEIAKLTEGREVVRCMANLTRAGDVHFNHTHPDGERIVLYYANPEWLPEWYGETMFFDEDGTSIIHAVRYTPGRFVVFDGSIPHAIRPQSSIGPQYRITIATIYGKPTAKDAS